MEFYTIPKGMENELYHYGVKGMKWGVRKTQKSSAIKKHSKKNQNPTDEEKGALKTAYGKVLSAETNMSTGRRNIYSKYNKEIDSLYKKYNDTTDFSEANKIYDKIRQVEKKMYKEADDFTNDSAKTYETARSEYVKISEELIRKYLNVSYNSLDSFDRDSYTRGADFIEKLLNEN